MLKERKIITEKEAKDFITEQITAIKNQVQNHKAIGFLSGGVDSSVVAILAHRALGENLCLIFVKNGLMREDEPEGVAKTFSQLGISVKLVEAADKFFKALAGKINPFDKRTAIRDTFYQNLLPELAKEFGAEFLLQGTILTDIEATAKSSIAPQHNVLEQIGIGISLKLVEPLKELRKPSVRVVAKTLGLPETIWNRKPFLGPALAGRIVGEVTPEKVIMIRKATKIVEEELAGVDAFQYIATLISDIVPNNDRTKIGYALAVRAIDSTDALTVQPTQVDWKLMIKIRDRIYQEIPEIFRVCWDVSAKPPAAVEWV